MLKAWLLGNKWLYMAVLVMVALLVYYPGLSGGFFFDDEASILQNEGTQLEKVSAGAIQQAMASGTAGPFGRPISQLSFALNYYFSGFDPFAFKATNLVIHCLNGILVFLIAQYLIRRTHPKIIGWDSSLLAGFVAAAWLLHPIQLTSVLYVVQRMVSLSAFFLLAAMLLHIAARERKELERSGVGMLLLAWVVLWPLSVLSKESGILYPGFVAAYELIVRRHALGRLDRFGHVILGLSVAVLLGGTFYLLTPHAQWLFVGYELRPFSLYERLLTEARVIWMYLGLIFMPHQEAFALQHDDMVVSSSMLSPWTTLPALIGLGGLVGIAWQNWKRLPIVTFSITWFFVGHSLESTFLPLEMAHEHRNYIALFGILFLPIAVWPNRAGISGKWRTAGIALLGMALAYSVLMTALRSHQFGNEVRRTQLEAMYHPGSARTNYEAAVALSKELSANPSNLVAYAFARKHYEQAGQLDPNFKASWLGLIHLNCATGKEVERVWINELSHRLQHTLFSFGDRSLMFSLKEMSIAHTICLERPDMQMLFSASFANPSVSLSVRAILYSWYADYLILRENDIPAAKVALGKSLQLVPANLSNRLKWAQLILMEGHRDEAARLLKALRNASLSSGEKKTAEKILACLEGSGTQCEKI